MPPAPPVQHGGGGLHLISSALAAEVVPVRHGKKNLTIPVSYTKPSHAAHAPSPWKLHATGPVQAPPTCHKNARGKMVCGPERL
jgi:hypothetical protein